MIEHDAQHPHHGCRLGEIGDGGTPSHTSDAERRLNKSFPSPQTLKGNSMMQLVRYDAAKKALAAAKSVDEVLKIKDMAGRMKAAARGANDNKLVADADEIQQRAIYALADMHAEQKKAGKLAKGSRGQLSGKAKGTGKGKGKAKAKVSGGSPTGPARNEITLAEAGIGKKLADQVRKAPPAEKRNAALAARREQIEAGVQANKVRGTTGTGENEWFTPVEYLDAARAVLGAIDLDPASNAMAQRDVKAATFFTKEDDGLSRDWNGRVWLNPPYAQPDIDHFATKMIAEIDAEHVDEAIMLTHNYTDTSWFQKLARHAAAICFTKGRIRFVSPDGDLASPTQGQAFFYFGAEPKKFIDEFKQFGAIVARFPEPLFAMKRNGATEATRSLRRLRALHQFNPQSHWLRHNLGQTRIGFDVKVHAGTATGGEP